MSTSSPPFRRYRRRLNAWCGKSLAHFLQLRAEHQHHFLKASPPRPLCSLLRMVFGQGQRSVRALPVEEVQVQFLPTFFVRSLTANENVLHGSSQSRREQISFRSGILLRSPSGGRFFVDTVVQFTLFSRYQLHFPVCEVFFSTQSGRENCADALILFQHRGAVIPSFRFACCTF